METRITELYAKLNLETAKVCWKDLEPHFARGSLLHVDSNIDLLDVAVSLANDDAPKFASWLSDRSVEKLSSSKALQWQQNQPLLWTVIVAPWVLVQEPSDHSVKQQQTQ